MQLRKYNVSALKSRNKMKSKDYPQRFPPLPADVFSAHRVAIREFTVNSISVTPRFTEAFPPAPGISHSEPTDSAPCPNILLELLLNFHSLSSKTPQEVSVPPKRGSTQSPPVPFAVLI